MVRATRYIEIIEQDDLLTRCRENGEYLLERLRGLAGRFPSITNVRGRGLMCAFDLATSTQRAACVHAAMRDEHLLILPCGAQSIRFRPVLDISRPDIDEAIDRLARVVAKLG